MSKEFMKEIGQRIKNIRRALHFNQRDFAAKINVSGSYLSEIEAGKSKPGFDLMYNMSSTCNANLHYVMHGAGEMFDESLSVSYMSSKEPSDQVESFNEIIWYVERSQLLRHTLISMASKYIYENEDIIKREVDMYKRKQAAEAQQKKQPTILPARKKRKHKKPAQ